MTIRPYDKDADLEALASWITDERLHALWCGGRTDFPLSRESFDALLDAEAREHDTYPFTALDDGGRQVGFFCMGANRETGEAMLKFIVITPELRGRGLGREMLSLAVEYGFDTLDAHAVALMVFSVNERALKCYKAAGFELRSVAEGAFRFGDELWDRCNMVIFRAPGINTKGIGHET